MIFRKRKEEKEENGFSTLYRLVLCDGKYYVSHSTDLVIPKYGYKSIIWSMFCNLMASAKIGDSA
jgi:hypothetical protein